MTRKSPGIADMRIRVGSSAQDPEQGNIATIAEYSVGRRAGRSPPFLAEEGGAPHPVPLIIDRCDSTGLHTQVHKKYPTLCRQTPTASVRALSRRVKEPFTPNFAQLAARRSGTTTAGWQKIAPTALSGPIRTRIYPVLHPTARNAHPAAVRIWHAATVY